MVFLPIVKRPLSRYKHRTVANVIEQFQDLVERRIRELETNTFAIEQRNGLPPDSIRNVLRGEKKNGPTLARVSEICAALGLDLYFGPRRVPTGQPGLSEQSGDGPKPRKGWLPMPWHDADRHPGAAPVAFDPSWFDTHQVVADRLAMVAPIRDAVGSAAEPREILALVDRMADRRGGPHAWALREHQVVALRQVQFVGGYTIIHPVRMGDPSRLFLPAAADLPALLGRVIWTCSLF